LNGLANGHNVSGTAATVVPHLCITLNRRAWLPWMAHRLASVDAIISLLQAPLTTSFLHQFFNCCEALSFWMTLLLADVAAPKRESTHLPTVWVALMAEYVLASFFTTDTLLSYLN